MTCIGVRLFPVAIAADGMAVPKNWTGHISGNSSQNGVVGTTQSALKGKQP